VSGGRLQQRSSTSWSGSSSEASGSGKRPPPRPGGGAGQGGHPARLQQRAEQGRLEGGRDPVHGQRSRGASRPQQQLPAEGGAAGGENHLQARVAAQQRDQPPQGHHRGFRLSVEQQAEAVPVVVGQGLAAQGLDAVEVPAHQLDRQPRAGGQHELARETGIEQQVPALLAPSRQGGAGAQHQHPGAEGPGEGQRRCFRRAEQPADRSGPVGQPVQQGGGLQRLPAAGRQAGGPAVPQAHQVSQGRRLGGVLQLLQHRGGCVQGAAAPGRGQPPQPGRRQLAAHQQQLLSPSLAAAREPRRQGQQGGGSQAQPQQLAATQERGGGDHPATLGTGP